MNDQFRESPVPVGIKETAAPSSTHRDEQDEKELRHGREVHIAYPVGRFLQTPPFFFTRDKLPVPLVDRYRGASAFLIASGPSFLQIDRTKLAEPSILTLGMNNSVKTFRPKMWTCVDDPANFLYSIWKDPTIEKFVPISHIDKHLFNSNEWQMTDETVANCPNVWYYKRNERFVADQYLWEDTINWGNHSNNGGGRSVMLAAVRILWLLGVRRIFLLGVDFNMSSEQKYHFAQNRSQGSIKGNNGTYRLLQERFSQLRPIFEANGLHVFNCNKESGLTVFDYMPFEEAYQLARAVIPANLADERTEGMYDRKANDREQAKKAQPVANQAAQRAQKDNVPKEHIEQIKAQCNAARSKVHEARDLVDALRLIPPEHPDFNHDRLTEAENDLTQKRKVWHQLLNIRKDLTGF